MNRFTEYRFVLIYEAPLEYGGERHMNKYNWQLGTHGSYTKLDSVRRSIWQPQLAVI